MNKQYKFSVVFEDSPELATSYTIQIKGAECYTDAMIKLIRVASLSGVIISIARTDE